MPSTTIHLAVVLSVLPQRFCIWSKKLFVNSFLCFFSCLRWKFYIGSMQETVHVCGSGPFSQPAVSLTCVWPHTPSTGIAGLATATLTSSHLIRNAIYERFTVEVISHHKTIFPRPSSLKTRTFYEECPNGQTRTWCKFKAESMCLIACVSATGVSLQVLSLILSSLKMYYITYLHYIPYYRVSFCDQAVQSADPPCG